jgi:hypothetical protein
VHFNCSLTFERFVAKFALEWRPLSVYYAVIHQGADSVTLLINNGNGFAIPIRLVDSRTIPNNEKFAIL